MVFEFSLHWLVQQLSDAPAWTQANKSRLERGFASNHCARTLLAYLKCATAPHAGWWPLTLSYSDSPCVLMQMSLGFQGRAFSPICQNPRSQVKGFFDLEMRFIIMCFLTLVLEVFNGIQSTLLWLTDRSWGLGGLSLLEQQSVVGNQEDGKGMPKQPLWDDLGPHLPPLQPQVSAARTSNNNVLPGNHCCPQLP